MQVILLQTTFLQIFTFQILSKASEESKSFGGFLQLIKNFLKYQCWGHWGIHPFVIFLNF